MSKGVIYVMTTVVPGLVKIGKTMERFDKRMKELEDNGYKNITGLKRAFAIEVEDYDEKEKLLHTIFAKSRLANTEFFALDKDLVIQLLSSFEGKQIYPEKISKETVFDDITKIINQKDYKDTIKKADKITNINNKYDIPDGVYSLHSNTKTIGAITGKMIIKDGICTLLKGSNCLPTTKNWLPKDRKEAKILNNILQEDLIVKSPYTAAYVIFGKEVDFWNLWINEKGESINKYRKEPEKRSVCPDGTYYLQRRKKSDNNKEVFAQVKVENGSWTLLKDSIIGVAEDAGVPENVKTFRKKLKFDNQGRLLEDVDLGKCSPSFAGCVVMNIAVDGWTWWKNTEGKPINIYRN